LTLAESAPENTVILVLPEGLFPLSMTLSGFPAEPLDTARSSGKNAVHGESTKTV
jgi:hypothetical protein